METAVSSEPEESPMVEVEVDCPVGAPHDEVRLDCGPTDGPFGVEIGRTMEPFTLTACDGTEYSLYGSEHCEATFTVVILVAGWCGPAIALSQGLESTVTEPYAPHGVRVITVLTQTEEFSAPDEAYCDGWTETFGLSNPVLIDPAQTTAVYFPGNALPAILIIDSAGTIRFRDFGYYASSIPDALDALLRGEDPPPFPNGGC
jgi:hypothetical protein